MSQSRTRRATTGSEGTRSRASAVKLTGDNGPSSRNKEQNKGSRSKNKLPESMRYDLESALVSLCDVWFEDIKPHLIRNNIKLHVVEDVEPPNSNHSCLPTGAPGCSHDDPAASAEECELCRLLFNAANSIESAVSQAASSTFAGTATTASIAASNSRFDVSDCSRRTSCISTCTITKDSK